MALTRLNNRSLAADADITADKLDVGQLGGRRNLIINGGMDVWQRGSSSTGTNYVFGPDRFRSYGYATNSVTISSQQEIGNSIGITNFARINSTSNRVYLEHRVEDMKQFSEKTYTLSYYARSSDVTALYPKTHLIYDGSAIDYSTPVNGTTAHTLSSSWQRFEMTFTFPDISGKTFGGSSCLDLVWEGTDGETGVVDITGVQLELGSLATPFEKRGYGDELALCQRYYIAFTETLGLQVWNHNIADTGGTRIQGYGLPCTMRTAPSASYTDDQGTSGQAYFEYPNSTNGRTNIGIFTTKHSLRGGFKYPYGALYGSNGDSYYMVVHNLKLDAEL